MTTEQAFNSMIREVGIHSRIGLRTGRVSLYRKAPPSIKTMEKLLRVAGWEKVPEQWQKGNPEGTRHSGTP